MTKTHSLSKKAVTKLNTVFPHAILEDVHLNDSGDYKGYVEFPDGSILPFYFDSQDRLFVEYDFIDEIKKECQ